jgi:hypothetical protein
VKGDLRSVTEACKSAFKSSYFDEFESPLLAKDSTCPASVQPSPVVPSTPPLPVDEGDGVGSIGRTREAPQRSGVCGAQFNCRIQFERRGGETLPTGGRVKRKAVQMAEDAHFAQTLQNKMSRRAKRTPGA